MTTYGIREFKAKASQILRDLKEGDEVIITRRGMPCGKLTAVTSCESKKPSLSTLRGAFKDILPEVTYQDFLDIKAIWNPRVEKILEAEKEESAE